MERKDLMTLFNSPNRIGTLSTADGQGNLNAGVFNSLRMMDEDTVVMAIGRTRSLANLHAHPRAVFLFFEPSRDPFAWKGARVYLKVLKMDAEGALFDEMRNHVRAAAGDRAAEGISAVVTFRIEGARPLIDPLE